MKTVLVVFYLYESIFNQISRSTLSMQTFDTMDQCMQAKAIAKATIRRNTTRIDALSAKCHLIEGDK